VGSSVGIGGTLTRPAPILVRVAVLVLAVWVRLEVEGRPEPVEGELGEPLGSDSAGDGGPTSGIASASGGNAPKRTSPSVGGEAAVPGPAVVPPPAVVAAAGTAVATAILPQTSQ
jgi:hypothetical protein